MGAPLKPVTLRAVLLTQKKASCSRDQHVTYHCFVVGQDIGLGARPSITLFLFTF